MNIYVFVVEYSGGAEYGTRVNGGDRWVVADTENKARRKLWDQMSDDERNAVSSIECVDCAPA